MNRGTLPRSINHARFAHSTDTNDDAGTCIHTRQRAWRLDYETG